MSEVIGMVSGRGAVVAQFDMRRLLTYHEFGPVHSPVNGMLDRQQRDSEPVASARALDSPENRLMCRLAIDREILVTGMSLSPKGLSPCVGRNVDTPYSSLGQEASDGP